METNQHDLDPAPDMDLHDLRFDPERYDSRRRAQQAFGRLKGLILPAGRRDRRLLAGLARGCVLPIDLRADLRLWLGLMEVELVRHFNAFVEEGSTCYDVGAHLGYYSLAAARRCGHGSVFAIEPDPERFATLQHTLAVNPHLADRVQPHQVAFGSATGDGAVSLDDFVAADPETRSPTFMKIDVDGPEYDILGGAAGVLANSKPRLIIETHSFGLEARCLGLLVEAGYVYLIVNAQRMWPELRPIELNRWIVALHRSDPRANIVLRK